MIGGLSVIVMLLWNLLIPTIFGITAINFWQALGLFILARLLLGGMSGRFLMGQGMHSHHNPVREKWMTMTSEERKEFIRRRHHHGHHFFNTEEPEKES
jgi:hypothetical protein